MNLTTVGDLIEALEDYDPSQPIMLAHQPSWPLAEVLSHIVSASECAEYNEEEDEQEDIGEAEDIVWLVLGGHDSRRSPYAPRVVFDR